MNSINIIRQNYDFVVSSIIVLSICIHRMGDIDLGNYFGKGQAYVALSRCQTLGGIYLTDFSTFYDI